MAVFVLDVGTKITDDKEKCEILSNHFGKTYDLNHEVIRLSAVSVTSNVECVADVDVSEFADKASRVREELDKTARKQPWESLFPLASCIASRLTREEFRICVVKPGSPRSKPGKKTDVKNERDVSLAAVSCTILEGLIANAIISNVERQGLISSNQFAYRKGMNTMDCLLL